MFNRLKYTAQGIALGSALTLALCAAAYLHTHEIKFTAVASNETKEARASKAIGEMTPEDESKQPKRASAQTKEIANTFVKAATPLPQRNPAQQ